MKAAAKKTRTASVDGTEHTDASLEVMKTGEIAALVASIRGGNPPKPATRAKAIELFWKSGRRAPKGPRSARLQRGHPGSDHGDHWYRKAVPEKAPKVKRYAIRADGCGRPGSPR